MKNKWWVIAKAVWTVFGLFKQVKGAEKVTEIVETVDAVVRAKGEK